MKTTRPIFPAPPVPSIRTERLSLRPVDLSEIEQYHAMRSNEQVMRYSTSGLVDKDRDATLQWLERLTSGGYGPVYTFSIYAMEGSAVSLDDHGVDANGGRFVGNIGFFDMNKPTIGYMIRREDWGRGYATEALKGALDSYWRLPRNVVDVEDDWPELKRYQTLEQDGSVREGLRAMIEVKNVGSKKVVEKCGFSLVEGKEWIPDPPDHRGQEKLVWYYLERPSECC
ncbi:hypothetical protein HDU86_002268 [Geranomyces michiganensis]|nr:hypothetical protein HDU86_002268 [Geranomyces michiganensis]